MLAIHQVLGITGHDIDVNEQSLSLSPAVMAEGFSSVISRGPEDEMKAKQKELTGIYGKNAVRPVQVQKGERVIGNRWVITHPEGSPTKARIVATEVAHSAADASLFANTPSLASLKIFLGAASASMQKRSRANRKHALVFLDISKAFLNTPIELAPGQPRILMRAPKEAGLPPGWAWECLCAMYGLRESPAR